MDDAYGADDPYRFVHFDERNCKLWDIPEGIIVYVGTESSIARRGVLCSSIFNINCRSCRADLNPIADYY